MQKTFNDYSNKNKTNFQKLTNRIRLDAFPFYLLLLRLWLFHPRLWYTAEFLLSSMKFAWVKLEMKSAAQKLGKLWKFLKEPLY